MRIEVDVGSPSSAEAIAISEADGAARATDGDQTLLLCGQPRDRATGQPLSAEALLVLHRRLGAELASELHGSYAIAVIDTRAPRVRLFNDRMAVQGWAWAVDGRRIRFSPRADHIADGAPLHPQALLTYLSNHVIPSPDTVFAGVNRLPPASRLEFDRDGVRLARHWTPAFAESTAASFGELREQFLALLRSAVAREAARLGGRIGSFLSGGTDSSTVSGLFRELTGAPVQAYSIGFDAEGYDEMAYARLAARHFGLQHREHYLTPDEVAEGMPKVAGSYDQPFGNSSAVAAYHCALVARQDGCTALLAGDGGDELFGGNARYAKQSIFGLYDQVPGPLRRALLEPLLGNDVAARLPLVRKASSYVQQARVPMPDRLQGYNLLRRLGLSRVLTPAFVAATDPGHDLAQQREVYAASAGAHLVNRMLAFDWRYTLADNDLPKVLGTTTLAGIATAFPLLADELIDFSLQLPHRYKLKGLKLRWFFKEALRGFLPDEIIGKRKQGFGLPFGVWALRHARLKALADDAMGAFASRGVVDAAFIRQLRDDLLPAHPGYYGELVWVITTLELWLREHRPDYRFS